MSLKYKACMSEVQQLVEEKIASIRPIVDNQNNDESKSQTSLSPKWKMILSQLIEKEHRLPSLFDSFLVCKESILVLLDHSVSEYEIRPFFSIISLCFVGTWAEVSTSEIDENLRKDIQLAAMNVMAKLEPLQFTQDDLEFAGAMFEVIVPKKFFKKEKDNRKQDAKEEEEEIDDVSFALSNTQFEILAPYLISHQMDSPLYTSHVFSGVLKHYQELQLLLLPHIVANLARTKFILSYKSGRFPTEIAQMISKTTSDIQIQPTIDLGIKILKLLEPLFHAPLSSLYAALVAKSVYATMIFTFLCKYPFDKQVSTMLYQENGLFKTMLLKNPSPQSYLDSVHQIIQFCEKDYTNDMIPTQVKARDAALRNVLEKLLGNKSSSV